MPVSIEVTYDERACATNTTTWTHTSAETFAINILVSKLSSLVTAALLFTALRQKGAKSFAKIKP